MILVLECVWGVMMGVSIGPAIDVLRKNMKSEEQEDNDEKE